MKNYLDLIRSVLNNGIEKSDRTGTGTISTFGGQLRFDLNKGFPAVTTKKLAFKSVVSELLWFLEGSTDERRLAEIHYGKDRKELAAKTTIWTANADDYKQKNYTVPGELGPVYGKQWRNWNGHDQIHMLVNSLKNNPDSRRHILNSWNVNDIEQMALPPCHLMAQFYVANNKLSCHMYQRSADLFLGVPFNIASYSILTHMLAQVCNLEVGDYIHSFGDVHIYKNHIEAVKEQLTREPLELPKLWINSVVKDINYFQMNDFKLLNYNSHDSISAPMAV